MPVGGGVVRRAAAPTYRLARPVHWGASNLQRHVRFGPVSELPNGRATLPGPFSGDRHVYARTDRGDSVRTGRIVYKRLYRQDGTLVGVYPVAVD